MVSKNREKPLALFKNKKALMISDLEKHLGLAKPTVRVRLKKWNAITSINQNGRYYTLPEIPKFDKYGIWHYRDIRFSKYGNLRQTFRMLVVESAAGLSATELGNILRLPVYPFLGHFKDDPAIRREKFDGLYIYFSEDLVRYKLQRLAREQMLRSKPDLELPTDTEAVVLLVTLIKHPSDAVEQLSRRVKYKGVNISIDRVRNLLYYHDLLKKTPDLE